MNQQIIKTLKAGIVTGFIAAIIEIIVSATMTETLLGQTIDPVQLALGGATIGLITLVLTIIISSIIAKYRQKI